ncbi:CehA/McbA family metallohydrolase [Paenibacillus chungangensis]|uniref:CehA/McbA family metallohydrolase n=1 Tax=Paenibacillus chungangensis TaxID=696535 RepID=A0ABW3HQ86_9BACL
MSLEKEYVIEQVFSRYIAKSEEKGYIEIPFELPEHTEKIQVQMDGESLKGTGATIDLGIKGPGRMRGWSGGARTEFTIGWEKATPGYLPGELDAGPWAVLLGAYRVPQEGCEVKLTVTVMLEQPRWLKGDLHTHTVHSDGAYTLREAVGIMEDNDCDFLATTDHNTVSQNNAHPADTDVILIPGVELTTNYGHANFLGAADPVLDYRATKMDDVHRLLQEAREAGARIVLNHPHCDYCPWEWDFEVDYDWVEVWNGPWSERNQRAVDWWHSQLAAGKRIAAVGGSDVHRPDPWVKHAMPTTHVFAASRTVKGILDGLHTGRVFMSYGPEGPEIDVHIGTALMGDAIQLHEGVVLHGECSVQHVRQGDVVEVISEIGPEHEASAEEDGSLTLTWPVADRLFYRVEVWRYFPEVDRTLMAALGNPIYLKKGNDDEQN